MKVISSYMQKVIEERGGNIRFIKAVEDDAMCWFYLKLSPEKLAEYEQQLKKGECNIRDYGTIIESNWGEYPNADVLGFMKDEYDFDTPPKSA